MSVGSDDESNDDVIEMRYGSQEVFIGSRSDKSD